MDHAGVEWWRVMGFVVCFVDALRSLMHHEHHMTHCREKKSLCFSLTHWDESSVFYRNTSEQRTVMTIWFPNVAYSKWTRRDEDELRCEKGFKWKKFLCAVGWNSALFCNIKNVNCVIIYSVEQNIRYFKKYIQNWLAAFVNIFLCVPQNKKVI